MAITIEEAVSKKSIAWLYALDELCAHQRANKFMADKVATMDEKMDGISKSIKGRDATAMQYWISSSHANSAK